MPRTEPVRTDLVHIDGSYGEGGGQIVRTCLTLAAVTGRPLEIENIRAGRKNPGLAAQHLTAVRAVAALCRAEVQGDTLGSQRLRFAPGGPPQPGTYNFDVAAAREGGSAGAAMLVAQSILLPLALAAGPSDVRIKGGTHVHWSPSFDFARDSWLPTLKRMGVAADLELVAWGFYPAGGGEVRLSVRGMGGSAEGEGGQARLKAVSLRERGRILRVAGRAVAANLPAHIAQRMADRARARLAEAGIPADIMPLRVRAVCPGAGIFLCAETEAVSAGFGALGERGKPAETVAEEAVEQLLAYHASGAAIERHLADQLVLPAVLADGVTVYTAEQITRHLTTSAWVAERFGLASFRIEGAEGAPGTVTITPAAAPV
jgi:RNA 3'-terminal phosphate cyclase (ATP)